MNTNKVYGYDDWFIPSYQEMVAMYNALPDALIWNKTGAIDTSYALIWTSSESPQGELHSGSTVTYLYDQAYRWYGDYEDNNFEFDLYTRNYMNHYYLLAARAF